MLGRGARGQHHSQAGRSAGIILRDRFAPIATSLEFLSAQDDDAGASRRRRRRTSPQPRGKQNQWALPRCPDPLCGPSKIAPTARPHDESSPSDCDLGRDRKASNGLSAAALSSRGAHRRRAPTQGVVATLLASMMSRTRNWLLCKGATGSARSATARHLPHRNAVYNTWLLLVCEHDTYTRCTLTTVEPLSPAQLAAAVGVR